MTEANAQVQLPPMCNTHQVLLTRQCGYGPKDPWRALVIMAQVALFQGASADPKVHAEVGGDITKFEKLGCLACRKPDLFGQVVEAGNRELGAIKTLGEDWVKAGSSNDKAAT